MTRYFAFLRAINVGGHTVKMETLRGLFAELGFTRVETFIASGNVIFESSEQDETTLITDIQTKLFTSLGYQVGTFIRTQQELAFIAAQKPFTISALNSAAALNVAFLSTAPCQSAIQKLMTLKTNIDDFHIHEREIYWLCQNKQSESTFSNAVLEKILGSQSTLRGIGTIKKLAEKYSA